MKRKFLLPLIVLAAALVTFVAYRIYDRHITDRVAPKITIEETGELLQVSVSDPETALLQGVTAVDARDGDVTDSLIVESVNNISDAHQATVTYAAFDRGGNVAKIQRTVQYTDYRSPRFTLTGPLVFPYGSRTGVLDYIGAQDDFDGDIGYRVKTTMMDETTISAEGIHHVLFRVTNSLGDTEERVLPVEVYGSNEHTAQLTLTEYILYLPAGSTFDANAYLDTFQLSGETADLSRGVPDNLTLEIRGAVNTNEPGVYPVAYTVKATRGGLIYSGYSKLIVIVEG